MSTSGKKPHAYEDLNSRVPLGVGPLGETVVAGQQKLFLDLDKQPTSSPGLEWLREEGIREYRIAPIRFKEEPLGAAIAFARGDLP